MSRPSARDAVAWSAAVCLVAAAGLVARATDGAPAPRQAIGANAESVVDLLSGIDFVPTREPFDDLLGATAPDDLVAIARGDLRDLDDPGVRIRAYRALALYPRSAGVREALVSAVSDHGAAAAGIETLYVRAAMDSLAQVSGGAAVVDLSPMLDHPSQDVRAAAAMALATTDSTEAVEPLRARFSTEEVLQVRLAIAEALRQLGDTDPETTR